MIPLLLGLGADLILGDPAWSWHPVRLMGRFIAWGHGLVAARAMTPSAQKAAGLALSLATILGSAGLGWSLMWMAGEFWPPLAGVVLPMTAVGLVL